MYPLKSISILFLLISSTAYSQIVHFKFEGNANGEQGTAINGTVSGTPAYVDGFDGKAIRFSESSTRQFINLGTSSALDLDDNKDFTIQIWVKTNIDSASSPVIFSNSDLREKASNVFGGIYGMQKLRDGWSIYARDGSWGVNVGDGVRNYWYEPFPGTQVLNDNTWHQIVFSHLVSESSLRIYFDGRKRAIINISDLTQDISSSLPTCIAVDGRADNSEFDQFVGQLDNAVVWDRTLTDEEVAELYGKHFSLRKPDYTEKQSEMSAIAWNIWHGGTHFTIEEHGWDGAERVAEIIKELDVDFIMMQETYGAGPKIASILDYEIMIAASLFSAKVWGSNISVLSRYPLKRGYQVKGIPENNGGAHIKVSKQQDVIVFSNWSYGDNTSQLVTALDHWSELIDDADNIPVLWGGDFNSSSHLDGAGASGHSRLMTDAGFKDSFRELNDAENRIDYLYYQGKDMRAVESDMMRSSDFDRYPSDHPIVYTEFEVDFPVQNSLGNVKNLNKTTLSFNPVNRTCNVDLVGMTGEKIGVNVFNILGQRVISKSFRNDGSAAVLSLGKFKNGMYVISISTENVSKEFKVIAR